MINISNSLKQACNSDKITYREYVVLTGTTTQIDVKTEMYSTAYKDTHFIGTFNMKYIKFTTSNDVKYRNKELILYKEINGESFKVGNFIVTEIKDSDSNEEVTVTAYDYGLKFAQPYLSNLDYSTGNITLKNVLDEICTNIGVELANDTITNGDFIVDSNQFVNGEMYGDVISAIAYLSGDFATINNDDKLKFVFNTITDEIIEDYVDLQDKRDTRPITSLSIGTSQVEGQNAVIKDEDLINQYGEHWLTINDVPFAYTLEKREQLKTAIFDKIKGFGYSSFKSEYAFKPYLELGDLIQFKNKDGELVNSIILRITTKYDNIILEAPSVTDATIDYEMPETAYDIAKRAEVIANQNTAEINLLAKKIVDVSQEITSAGAVNITDASNNGLHKLSIRGNITLTYPSGVTSGANATKSGIYKSGVAKSSSYVQYSEGTFPGEDLYPLTMDLVVSQENKEDKVYELPFGHLRSLGNVYDEFVCLDGNMSLIRRIGLKTNGDKYILKKEIIEDLGFMNIEIPEGNSTIKLKWFDSAIFDVVYLLKNEYTEIFASQVELESQINVKSEEIQLLSKRTIDNEEKMSELIVSPDDVRIKSDKIILEGSTTINGNTSIDEEGNLKSLNGEFSGDISASNITGSSIKGSEFKGVGNDSVKLQIGTDADGYMATDNSLELLYGDNSKILGVYGKFWENDSLRSCYFSSLAQGYVFVGNRGLYANGFTNNSQKRIKKNFNKFKNASNIIKNSDIYTYNLKTEKDDDKKHIGLVIGEEYNTPEEIMDKTKSGIDLYAMISVAWQSIKELNEKIERLERELKRYKNKESEINEKN